MNIVQLLQVQECQWGLSYTHHIKFSLHVNCTYAFRVQAHRLIKYISMNWRRLIDGDDSELWILIKIYVGVNEINVNINLINLADYTQSRLIRIYF